MKFLLLPAVLGVSVVACTGPDRAFPEATGATAGPGGGAGPGPGTGDSTSAGPGDGGAGVGGTGAGGPGQGGAGQGGDGAGASDGGAGGGTPSTLDVSAPDDAVVVRTDDSATVAITVERTGPADEPATITVIGLPDGVTADALEIPAGETTGDLTLRGADDATQGLASVEVVATVGDLDDTAPLALLVAGAPGSLDETFADAGLFDLQLGAQGTRARAVAIQADGKIVVAGSSSVDNGQMVAVRLDDQGVLDPGFNETGAIGVGVGTSAAVAVAIDDDGRVLLGGSADPDFNSNNQFAMVALLADGTLDSSFGDGGAAISGAESGSGSFRGIYPTADSVVGIGSFSNGSLNGDTRVYEYTAALAQTRMDATFLGFTGRQPDGKFLYGGRDGSLTPFITRLASPATVDTTFNGSGTATVTFEEGGFLASGVHVDDDGRILVGGVVNSFTDPLVVFARFNADGSLDGSFGAGGKVVTAVGMRTYAGSSVAVDGQGRILFAGYVQPASTAPAVARFLPDGSPDATFGTDGSGLVMLDLPTAANSYACAAYGVALDELDRVILVGEFGDPDAATLFASRLWF